MKKTILSLAVLAATSGIAFAQSNVSLYGNVDEAFVHTTKTGEASQNLISSGGISSSKFGLKGSEDLGGGLKANFQLEQSFNADDGSTDIGTAFGRYSNLGFSGSFGEVKFGVTGTAFDDLNGVADAAFNATALGLVANVFESNNYSWHPGNSIYYVTPTLSGFTGSVSYSAAEGGASISSASVKYENGPLYVGLALQNEKPTVVGAETEKFTRLNATYDFGVVKAQAAYGRIVNVAQVTDQDAKEFELGVEYPVNSALTLSAGYARSSGYASTYDVNGNRVATGVDSVRKGYSLSGMYSLSKRTSVYAGYLSQNDSNGDIDKSTLAVGVAHKF